ncbi:MAG: TIGR00159 family protein [Nitrospirae bacterium]|nr:TIGR00159 family protein [Nitrospirota bacterium]MBI3351198.1 TIGR00159 family protein [Nitrospirota bacterium]
MNDFTVILQDLLSHFRWLDLFDILLVSYLIYRILVILKGSRALHMLTGLSFLLLVLLFSKWLDLYTLDWLVTNFWSQIILALIILFQPEIRRVLVQIGLNPFKEGLLPLEGSRTLEEILKAINHLSNRKIGAVIVLEREIEIKETAELGLALDSIISKEILISIFETSSPIHDGAVIIRGNRIVSAGCFLPLSFNPSVNKKLGTRHRAAIGITEEGDAVVLVVSEETGKISVISGGVMSEDLKISEVRERLRLLLFKEKKPGFLRPVEKIKRPFAK